MKKIYIAGKMKGLRNLGYQKFFDKAEELIGLGWLTVNPADFPYEGVEVEVDGKKVTTTITDDDAYTYHKVLHRDFQLISSCTAIYMLKGWAESSGASTELAVAKLLGLEVIFEATEDRGRAHTRAMASMPGFKVRD